MPGRTSVIVLGYGPEPYLEQCLSAITGQLGGDDELVLVDNGFDRSRLGTLAGHPSLRLVGTGDNTGFAGGCLDGADAATGDVLVFVNSDAIVRTGAIATLAAAVRDHPEHGLVSGCLRLADRPELVNSVGNPLQFLGLTWAGHCGEPAADHRRAGPVAVATGGLFAVGRTTWQRLGGFDRRYFAYHEDTDLSLRCWLGGQSVQVEPTAVADHHYEFSRNPEKFFLLERNRLVTVLTDYPPRLLAAVLPALLLVEPALFAMALAQGWARHKLRAWRHLLGHGAELRTRRAEVQATVRRPEHEVAALMVARIDPPMVAAPPGMGVLNTLLAVYWSGVCRWLAGGVARSARQPGEVDAEPGQRSEAQAEHHPGRQVER